MTFYLGHFHGEDGVFDSFEFGEHLIRGKEAVEAAGSGSLTRFEGEPRTDDCRVTGLWDYDTKRPSGERWHRVTPAGNHRDVFEVETRPELPS